MNKLSCIFNLMTILYVLFTEKVLNVVIAILFVIREFPCFLFDSLTFICFQLILIRHVLRTSAGLLGSNPFTSCMYTQISGYLLPHKENHDSDIGSLTRSD